MNYRKKPVVIQATQWFKDGDHPAVIRKTAPNRHADEGVPWVPTLEGGHVVTPGDWIITGVKGEHYPCKPDIFEMTYESAALDTAQPVQVNAMLVGALQAAEKLEHEALVALSEATYELKVGNTYTTATDTYKAHNDLIHRLDKILSSQCRDRKRAAITAAISAAKQAQPVFTFVPWSKEKEMVESWTAQQAQPEPAYVRVGEDGEGQENYCPDCGAEPGQMCSSVEGVEWGRRVHVARQQAQPVCGYDDETGNCTRVNCCKQAQPEQHLFELWWAEYMPEAAQEQAFKAWSAAPGSKGVGVEQQAQPEPSEMTTERESYIAGLESRTHEMRKKIEQLDYELRVARSSQERATYTPPKIIDPDAPHPCFN